MSHPPHVRSLRHVATAFGLGATAALVVDVALQNALEWARSPGVAPLTPWWVVGQVAEQSVWIAAALLLWIGAPGMAGVAHALWPASDGIGRPSAYQLAGRLLLIVPLVWWMATWLVLLGRLLLAGGLGPDGRIFLSGYYYYTMLLAYMPWAAGGLVLLTLSRHVGRD